MSTVVITFVDDPPLTFVTNSYDYLGGFFVVIQRQGNIQVTNAYPASDIKNVYIESQT